MKKSIKMIVGLALVVIMGVCSQENVLATPAMKDWQIIKTPGKTNVQTTVTMPYHKGQTTYELISLTGTCTYVVARVEADPDDIWYYWLNVYNTSYEFTKPATQELLFAYTPQGILVQPNLTLVMSIKHNSTNLINETLTSTGTITYE